MQKIKLGLDCPTGWLGKVQPLADYDYVLVDQALNDPCYLDYFVGSMRTKILNNRVRGTGIPLALGKIKMIWTILGSGYVIAPDWMGSPASTMYAYEECCEKFGRDNVIGVIQSTKKEDLEACQEIYGERIAIPFDVGSEKGDSPQVKISRRVTVADTLKDRKIHLLGLVHPNELRWYGSSIPIESLNTGLPLLLATQGIRIRDFRSNKKDSSYHSLDLGSPPLNDETFNLIEDNIKELRDLYENK